MIAVFLGPPGAGKGTQATGQAERLKLRYVATGDELRRAISEATPLGRKAEGFVESGRLVPDELIVELVGALLAESAGRFRGVLFDGFPRTIAQAEALDMLLGERGLAVSIVLYLDASPEAIVPRLSGRRVCRRCGATYHVSHLPPRREGVCDRCGGGLYRREDDEPETVRERLRVYQEQTAELLDYYRDRRVLVRVDAEQSVEDVRRAVEAALDGLGGPGDP